MSQLPPMCSHSRGLFGPALGPLLKLCSPLSPWSPVHYPFPLHFFVPSPQGPMLRHTREGRFLRSTPFSSRRHLCGFSFDSSGFLLVNAFSTMTGRIVPFFCFTFLFAREHPLVLPPPHPLFCGHDTTASIHPLPCPTFPNRAHGRLRFYFDRSMAIQTGPFGSLNYEFHTFFKERCAACQGSPGRFF